MESTVIQIRPNRYQLFGKIIIQVLFGALLWLALFVVFSSQTVGSTKPAICFSILMALLNTTIFIQLFYLATSVTMDETSRSLQIKFLLRPDKNYLLNNIESYSTTKILTKSDVYKGILLKIKDGSKVLLSDFNLNDYTPIKNFLEELNVECTGTEKFKFFSYYWNAK